MSDNKKVLEFPVVENFSPEVPLEIFSLTDTIKIVATVDTGSTGFLSIPLAVGLKANLRLFSTRYWKMADGRKVKKLECFGKIRFAGKEIFGIIALSETSDECLLGMQFLERLGGDFTVSIQRNKAIFEIQQEKTDLKKKNIKKKPNKKKTRAKKK